MRIERYLLGCAPGADGACELVGEQAHHCAHVMRHGPGDRVLVFDGRGGAWIAEVLGPGGAGDSPARSQHAPRRARDRAVDLRVIREAHDTEVPREVPAPLILAIALPKTRGLDLCFEKPTEVGVTHIAPMTTVRSIVRLDAELGDTKRRRFEAICEEACKQCGRAVVPAVLDPLPLDAALSARFGLPDDAGSIVRLFPHIVPPLPILYDCARDAYIAAGRALPTVLYIGPEGGFTDDEAEAAIAAGATPVTMGPRVMRSETAATTATAFVAAAMESIGARA